LEKWLNEFAKGQGIRSPNVDEKKLEGVQNEVPKPENIQQKGQELTKDVEKKIGDTQSELSRRKNELKNYSPPKVKPFNLQAPKINLSFYPNDPKFKLYEENVQSWFINQPNPISRAGRDAKDTVVRGAEWTKNFINDLTRSPKQPVGDRLNTPPLLGVP
jgi:hypothetical protein